MIFKSLQPPLATLLISGIAAWASTPVGPARIQGVVKDSRGQPIAGAEVHIQAKDGSGLQKIVRTDAGGNYGCSKLPATYAAAGQQKKKTHMVYVPAETGSNLSGHWVEVDDQTGPAATATSGNLQRGNGQMIRSFQSNSGSSSGGN